MNGSVATDSGLPQLRLFGAEKAELPHEDRDESENEEQTEPERSNAGWSLPRLSLMSAHSFAGLSTGELKPGYVRGAGVFGGVTRRWNCGSGARRPCEDGVAWNIGLDISFAASDISIVGITVSDIVASDSCGNSGIAARLRLTLKACGRGGGGGCTVECCASSCCRSGVFGS